MSGFRVGRQAQMIPVLHSMADQDAAPTLSSNKIVRWFHSKERPILTSRIRRIGNLLQADETNDAGNADAR